VQSPPVHARVADQDVVAGSGAQQPESLGQGESHHTVPAGPGQRPPDEFAAAYRLAGHPDRLALRPADQRFGIAVERTQVDQGEWRIQLGGDPVVPGTARGAARIRAGRADRRRSALRGHAGRLTGFQQIRK